MSLKNKYNTIILGGGLTGLSVARNLKNDYLIVEKNSCAGGLCKSVKKDGFTFDYTGHLLHLRNPWSRKFVFRLLKKNLFKIERSAWIYSENVFTKYPYQLNLYGLSKKTISECIRGLLKANASRHARRPANPSDSFHSWSLRTFGDGITKHFLKPYNEKLWGISAKKLTAEWVNEFVPTPKPSDVIVGARTDSDKKIGYNASFFYPKNGGIQSLVNAILESEPNIVYNEYAKKIDVKNKYVVLSSGEKLGYENLITTIPLPEFLAAADLKNLAEKLDWTSVLCFNLGVKGDAGHNKHWVYFPEKKQIFYRVGFYSNIADKTLAPSGHYSMYVEVSHHRGKKLNLMDVFAQVVTDLLSVGFLKSRKDITTLNILPIKYGYIVYDGYRTPTVEKTKESLKKDNIYLAGRYGAWKYSYMEESILEGKSLADIINLGFAT